jgi:hypothetical protein
VPVKVRGVAGPPPSGIVTSEEWGGYVKGEPVKVRGRKGKYRFQYHSRTLQGNEWVTVYGGSTGPDGARQFVSVGLDDISKVEA